MHDVKPADADVRPLGKFFGSIMQAPRNISTVLVAEDISKLERSWLKEVAPPNMLFISVTEEVSKLERSWLNEVTPSYSLLESTMGEKTPENMPRI